MNTSKHTHKIAILGASGSIGKLCTQHFQDQGHKVIAVGRSKPALPGDMVDNRALDYDNSEELQALFSEVDAVLVTIGIKYSHASWQEFWVPFAKNIASTVRSTKTRTIFFDNVYSYGLVKGAMTEETEYNPISKKGMVRHEVDQVLDELIADGFPVVVAKSPDFYGPGAIYSTLSQRFHDQLAQGKFEWLGNPELEHTLGYIPDFPPALLALAQAGTTGIYHLPVSSESMSANKIKSILEAHTGKTYKYSLVDGLLLNMIAIFIQPLRELKEMMYQYRNPYTFESTKILTEFPHLTTTDLKSGIIAQYESYQK